MSDALPTFLSLDFDPLSPNGIAIICPLCRTYHVTSVGVIAHPFPGAKGHDWPARVEILMYCDERGHDFSLFLGDGPGDQDGTDLTCGPPSKQAQEMHAAMIAEDEVPA